jgi:hypothetical protein
LGAKAASFPHYGCKIAIFGDIVSHKPVILRIADLHRRRSLLQITGAESQASYGVDIDKRLSFMALRLVF